jgi:hypothetical protein
MLHEKPGPGEYQYSIEQTTTVDEETHLAFKSKTDRGLIPETQNYKGPLSEFMINLIDKEKSRIVKNIINPRQRNVTHPKKTANARPEPPGDDDGKLKHCLLTTLPAHKQPSTLAEAVGNLHSVHLHNENNPRDRLVLKRPLGGVPFGTQRSRFVSLDKGVPGPGHYNSADNEIEWNPRSFNVNYMANLETC